MFALFGLGRIGCIPHSISSHSEEVGTDISKLGPTDVVCVESMNDAVTFFNHKLESLAQQLNSNLTDARFVYFNPHPESSEINSTTPHGTYNVCSIIKWPITSSRKLIIW